MNNEAIFSQYAKDIIDICKTHSIEKQREDEIVKILKVVMQNGKSENELQLFKDAFMQEYECESTIAFLLKRDHDNNQPGTKLIMLKTAHVRLEVVNMVMKVKYNMQMEIEDGVIILKPFIQQPRKPVFYMV